MPRFASQPSATTVFAGSSQVLACEVNSDLVPFTRWEKDRQPLETGSRLLQLPSGALVLSNASEADAGLYRCVVENVGSSKSSDEAQVQIAPGSLHHPHSLANIFTSLSKVQLRLFVEALAQQIEIKLYLSGSFDYSAVSFWVAHYLQHPGVCGGGGGAPTGLISDANSNSVVAQKRLDSSVAVSGLTPPQALFTELLSTRPLAAQTRYYRS